MNQVQVYGQQWPVNWSVGKVERANPLPPGRYWIDVIGDNIPIFDAWLEGATGLGFVRVESTEHFDAKPAVPPLLEARPARNWVLFRVLAHTAFDNRRFGFPTIAEANIKTSSDTVQRPPPEKGFFDDKDNMEKVLWVGGGVLGAILLIKLLK